MMLETSPLLLRKHQATHRARRQPWASRLEYLKYVYYRYAIEREHGHLDAAEAVLEGVCDALAGCYGAYVPRARVALPMLRALFAFRFRRQVQPTKK